MTYTRGPDVGRSEGRDCPAGGDHAFRRRDEGFREVRWCIRCGYTEASRTREVDKVTGQLRRTPGRPYIVLREPSRQTREAELRRATLRQRAAERDEAFLRAARARFADLEGPARHVGSPPLIGRRLMSDEMRDHLLVLQERRLQEARLRREDQRRRESR